MKHYNPAQVESFTNKIATFASAGWIKAPQVEKVSQSIAAIAPEKYTKKMSAVMQDAIDNNSVQAILTAMFVINDRAQKVA